MSNSNDTSWVRTSDFQFVAQHSNHCATAVYIYVYQRLFKPGRGFATGRSPFKGVRPDAYLRPPATCCLLTPRRHSGRSALRLHWRSGAGSVPIRAPAATVPVPSPQSPSPAPLAGATNPCCTLANVLRCLVAAPCRGQLSCPSSFSLVLLCCFVPSPQLLWLSRLVTGCCPRRLGSDPSSVHGRFVGNKVALGQFCPVSFIQKKKLF